jgi:hypothetical protein
MKTTMSMNARNLCEVLNHSRETARAQAAVDDQAAPAPYTFTVIAQTPIQNRKPHC